MAYKFILVDGVNNYNSTNDLFKLWDTVLYATVESQSPRRAGTNYLKIDASIDNFILKNIPLCTDETGYYNTAVIGAAVRVESLPSYNYIYSFAGHDPINSNNGRQLTLTIEGCELCLYRGSHTDTLLARSIYPIIKKNTWHYIEMKARLHSTLGHYTVNVDGQPILYATGVNTFFNSNQYELTGVALGSGDIATDYTDIYMGIGDAPLLSPCVIDVYRPIANGTSGSASWTPVGATYAYQCIDKQYISNDTQYIRGDFDLNASQSFNFETITEYKPYDTKLICLTIAGGTQTAGARKIRARVDTPTDTLVSDDYVIFSGPEYKYKQIFSNSNPFLGDIPWRVSEINTYNFGIEDY